MATTFNVFYLGIGPTIDPTEGNTTSENANALVGNTYGSVGDPLSTHIQTFSPGSTGFQSGVSNAYDTNNSSSSDTFRIDGGANQVVDGITVYDATITYLDGSTATISAVLIQDTSGGLYLLPEMTFNADQVALEAQPIRSLTLDGVANNNAVMASDRAIGNFVVCFTTGTAIGTPRGDRLIDDLKVGDAVTTMDNGPQHIRWIGRRTLDHAALLAEPNLRPILIRKGLLGAARDLLVSPQHGMLMGKDNLVRAKHLADAGGSGIRIAHGRRQVTYVHLMFDAHQIIFAEQAPTESFYPGPMAQRALNYAAYAELSALFPDVVKARTDRTKVAKAYGATARTFLARKSLPGLLARHDRPPGFQSGFRPDGQARRTGMSVYAPNGLSLIAPNCSA